MRLRATHMLTAAAAVVAVVGPAVGWAGSSGALADGSSWQKSVTATSLADGSSWQKSVAATSLADGSSWQMVGSDVVQPDGTGQ